MSTLNSLHTFLNISEKANDVHKRDRGTGCFMEIRMFWTTKNATQFKLYKIVSVLSNCGKELYSKIPN